MKKSFIIGLTAILAAVISFAGCEPIENSSQIPQTNEAKIEAAKGELAIPMETDRDLDLPAVLNGVAISWASSDEAVISSTGLVTRQFYDAEATLTATLALGSVSDTKEFEVTVPAIVFEEEEAELVELTGSMGLSSTWSESIRMKYMDENVVFVCSVDNGYFNFPADAGGERGKIVNARTGIRIGWIPRELDSSTSVILQAFAEIVLKLEKNIIGYAVIDIFNASGLSVENNSVILKSVIFPQVDGKYQNISEEYVKTAIEKVKAENSDEKLVAAAKEDPKLILIFCSNPDFPPAGINRVYMYTRCHCNRVTISWASSDEAIINSSTYVVTLPYPETEVTLTATLTRGSVVDTKEITLLVSHLRGVAIKTDN